MGQRKLPVRIAYQQRGQPTLTNVNSGFSGVRCIIPACLTRRYLLSINRGGRGWRGAELGPEQAVDGDATADTAPASLRLAR